MQWFRNARASGLSWAVLGLGAAVAGCQSHPAAQQQPQQQQAARVEIKILDNPSGGQYAIGALTSQTNKADALVYMLHQVHGKFGDKPAVGKLFQSRDGSTLATFFTLRPKNMNGTPVAGLLIITQRGNGVPQMGILYDYANRFVTTEPVMLKAVSTAWQGMGAPSGGSAPRQTGQTEDAPRGGPEKLYPATGGDRSAMISLPPGWQLTSVAGGAIFAQGTHGEMVGLQAAYQGIIDPRYPQSRQLIYGPMGGRGPKLVCPLGEDLFEDYVCVVNQARRNNGKSEGTFRVTSEQPQQGPGRIRPVLVLFTVDYHDGMGPRNGSGRLDLLGMAGPTWALAFSMSNIPEQYAASEAETLKAVVASYRRNESVISAENAAVMDRIRQQAAANEAQAKALNERREQSSQAFDQHMGNLDWQSKITQDYILDRTVVKDNDYDGTATVGNKFADYLIKTNPDRFEVVPNQELIRGRDY